jgi:putative oxidoreductase
MLSRFFETSDSRLRLAQRLVLGLVMFPHGAQKLLGWFGGYGWRGTMGFFTDTLHIPAPLAVLVIASEFFGSLALIAGLGTRLAALGATATMVGAVLTSHLDHGFFMNWFGAQKGEGFEYHLLALALSVPLMLEGAGAFSLDRFLLPRLRNAPVLATA